MGKRSGNIAGNTPFAVTIALVLALAVPAIAQAQLDPYIAFFGAQAKTDWSRGTFSEPLKWRPAAAVEVGIQLMGLTISPGFIGVGEASWSVEDDDGNMNDYYLQYRAVYLNLGAREDFGVYFSGGLNYTIWDVVPQPPDDIEEFTVDGEIGFQAYLGFIISLEKLPLKFLFEAGYAQFNGNGGPLPAGTPADFFQVSSTGPMARVGIAIGK